MHYSLHDHVTLFTKKKNKGKFVALSRAPFADRFGADPVRTPEDFGSSDRNAAGGLISEVGDCPPVSSNDRSVPDVFFPSAPLCATAIVVEKSKPATLSTEPTITTKMIDDAKQSSERSNINYMGQINSQ